MRAALVAATLALPAFTPVPVTHANPDPDPHIRNMAANYCPNGGPKWVFVSTYCDGMPYADGSYWHIVRTGSQYFGDNYSSPSTSPMRCVVNPDGGPLPQPAPPGGCEGAVQ
jgi:hypothetical protein